MRPYNRWQRLRYLISLACDYAQLHRRSDHLLWFDFERSWRGEPDQEEQKARIMILAHGDLYEVTETFYSGGQQVRRETWLATYHWGSNGHYASLAEDKFIVMNEPKNCVYLLENTGEAKLKVTLYQKVKP